MTIDIEKSWNSILAASSEIESLAATENWQEVSELARNRHGKIQRHFDTFPVGPKTADFYSVELSGFIAREDKLQELVRQARKETLKSGIIINNRKKLANSYL